VAVSFQVALKSVQPEQFLPSGFEVQPGATLHRSAIDETKMIATSAPDRLAHRNGIYEETNDELIKQEN